MRIKKKFLKRRTKSLGIIIGIILFYSCTPKIIGMYQGHFMQKIEIKKDNTYKATNWLNYGVGSCTFNNTGTWEKKGNCLVLNSYNQPDNFDLISIKEKTVDTVPEGIIYLLINDDVGYLYKANGIPTLSVKATIDDKIYGLIGNLIKVNKPEITTFIIHGYDTDYPRYYVKNNKSNYFIINIKSSKGKSKIYQEFSYFTDEKLLIKKDTLVFHKAMNLVKQK